MKALLSGLLLMLLCQLCSGQTFGDTVCLGMQRVYHAPGGSVYNWQVSNGAILSLQNRDSVRVYWNTAGTGELTCIRSNTKRCFTDTVKLSVLVAPPAPGSISGESQVCEGKSYYYQPEGAAVWADGSRQPRAFSFGRDTVLMAFTHNPCGMDTVRKNIYWNFLPRADFAVLTSQPEVGLPIELAYQGPGTPLARWYLEGQDTITDPSQPPVLIPQKPGKARLRLVTQNAGGCSDSSSLEITIADNRRCHVPNSFTPNGDQYNPLFKPELTGASWMRMEIFNTWGQMVYGKDGLDAAWDGTLGGKDLPEGVYIYVIYLEFNGLKRRYTHEGTVHLLR